LAQAADGDIHGPVESVAVDAAQGLEKFVAVQRFAGVPDQEVEGREFMGGQANGPLVQPGLKAMEVDAQPAEMAPAVRSRVPRAPQHGLDAGHQFPRFERFGQIVVGPQFESHHLVHEVAARRQHDDGHGAALANALAQVEPVHAGKHQVEDNQIRCNGIDLPEPFMGVGGGKYFETEIGEKAFQKTIEFFIIVDDK
jgi:hypothetical protein